MKTIIDHLEKLLLLAAALQLAVAVLNFSLVRIMRWDADLARMPLLVREVFRIHVWFISITLAIFAVLTWRFAGEMAAGSSELARWLAAAIGIFWAARSILQWTHYSRSHWRGDPPRTLIHWLLFAGYGGFAAAYFLAAFRG